ncbi:hypothetical protein GCM10020358_52980 [Amorphoplanes nipponensis]|uniref:Uncharacterized protein n=1 Tax=Actinoplanes nipponensis TaxID=135950 RepID=A0A919JHG5_9ACTN|nr:hypothetical protein [Actinoplanes nipponensis]GIE49562.1 hypothetical protein Ani05nite_30960 [Actinoplanes nipponensis]
MTDPGTDREDLRPDTREEAAEIVTSNPALNTATDTATPDDDAATDDDARTPDSATAGETRD